MNHFNDKICIIMAAYNSEKTIRQAVDSVLNQTYSNLELIIANDCSTDSTLSIIEAYCRRDSRVRLINNTENMGVSRSRYKCLMATDAPWIAILDSDDAWTHDKLEKQIRLQEKTGAALLFTGSKFMDDSGNIMDWIMHVPATVNYRRLLRQNILSNSSSLCRRELYEKFYVIGDDMHEDFALWLKVLKSGVIAHGVDEPLLIYRLTPGSRSGNKRKSAIMNWKTYRNVGLNPISALYYQIWYIVKGLMKYRHLK